MYTVLKAHLKGLKSQDDIIEEIAVGISAFIQSTEEDH